MCVFNNKGCCISSFSRVYDEEQCRQELKVLVLDNDSLAEVEFRTASRPDDGKFLCELHLPIPVSCIYIFVTLDLELQLRHHSFLANYLLKPGFHMIVRVASWRLRNVLRNTRLVKTITLRHLAYLTHPSKMPSWLCY